jgi:hypothetical protein
MRPLSSDLREFINLLKRNRVKNPIVGAWALAFHGRPRYTGDLDIFVARDDDNADKLMAVIEPFGLEMPASSAKISCRSIMSFSLVVNPTALISLPESAE